MVENTVDVLTADSADSSTNQISYAGHVTGTEKILAEVLADVVDVEQVSVDSHFFDDLGANSLVMAHFCARVRKRADLPSVSMKDIYRHPTIKSLARELGETTSTTIESPAPAPVEELSTVQYTAVLALRSAAAADLLWLLRRCRAGRHPGLRVDFRRDRFDRLLRAVGPVRWRGLLRPEHPPDPREMGAHRSVEAPAAPRLEPGVRPLLDRQNACPAEPTRPVVRRFAALLALFAGARRESRTRRGDLLSDSARLHGPAHHRRRHRHSQGLAPHVLSSGFRPDSNRDGDARKGRVRRRAHGNRHRDPYGRPCRTRPYFITTHRSGRTRRRTLARIPGATNRRGLPDGRGHRMRHAAQGRVLGPAGAEPAFRLSAAGIRRY